MIAGMTLVMIASILYILYTCAIFNIAPEKKPSYLGALVPRVDDFDPDN
jgi:hypothetical protein